ncbi:MAG TPA: hypothetical protein VI542_14980 [Candidatus Tectomicrobia bacterium]
MTCDEVQEALAHAVRLDPASRNTWYNFAATHAPLHDNAHVLITLQHASRLNLALRSEATQDDDAKNLREDPDFLSRMHPWHGVSSHP